FPRRLGILSAPRPGDPKPFDYPTRVKSEPKTIPAIVTLLSCGAPGTPASESGVQPEVMAQDENSLPADPLRFTLDGSDSLEARLRALCARVSEGAQKIFPPGSLEALVLGGGYGRGEGGVLRTPSGHEPYNDIEFYLFARGPRLLNQRR